MDMPLPSQRAANLLAAVRRPRRPAGGSHWTWTQRDVVAALFVVLFLGLCLWLPGFARVDNLMTLLRNVSVLGMLGVAMAMAMALVVIGRGIDLSLVSLMVVPPGLALQLIHDGWGTGPALAAAIGLLLATALLNGWLVAYAEIPALFATLATGLLLGGLGQSVFFPLDIVPWPAALAPLSGIGRGSIAGVPAPVLSFLAVVAVVGILLGRTRLGLFVRATGDNPAGARLSGVPTRRVLVAKYLLAAAIAA
jgi:ribose transport system permease protein